MPTPGSEPPAEFDLSDNFTAELDGEPADERVYRVALQLYEPTKVAVIAERADCAPDTARRHLERLHEIGVLEQVADSPITYQRNESYFEWRKRSRLEQLSTGQLRDRLTELIEREQELREQYGANRPGAVDALDHADYDEIETVWMDLSEWETIRHRIRRLEDVRQQRAADSESETA